MERFSVVILYIMVMTKEERAAYDKEYRAKHKKRIAEKKKEYNEKNEEKRKIYKKEYAENHKEYLKEYHKEYNKTPVGKKVKTISNWKRIGVICNDFDSLYCHYFNADRCDLCFVLFGKYGDGTGTFKCMDHCHSTGLFRNFLCNSCNVKRG